jgi:hypothetical protein
MTLLNEDIQAHMSDIESIDQRAEEILSVVEGLKGITNLINQATDAAIAQIQSEGQRIAQSLGDIAVQGSAPLTLSPEERGESGSGAGARLD